MSGVGDRRILCPRCRYDLRGQTVPRCPECGLAFAAADFPGGLLREQLPGPLDLVDLLQPHRVLRRALGALVVGAARPSRYLRQLDFRGSRVRAAVMLLVGVGWLYALTVALFAPAIALHAVASPALAFRTAAVAWAPRVVLAALLAPLVLFAIGTPAAVLGADRITRRQRLRLLGHWLPVAGLYAVVPLGVAVLVEPEFALEARVRFVWPLLTSLALTGTWWQAVRGGHVSRVSRAALGWGVLGLLAWIQIAGWAGVLLLPETLDVPLDLYF